ncbi:MAG: Fe-S-containing hydro-lyase [Bacillota bacterium]
MGNISIETPFAREKALALRAGDSVLISGVLYTARDAAHKRMSAAVKEGRSLPFDIRDAIVYYVGPTPPREGAPVGSAGPTTSCRMDAYAPELLGLGLRGMIGKGERSAAVVDAMKKSGAVYFAAIGGAGALLARSIRSSRVIAYEDLGTEAIRRLEVVDFPAMVAIDAYGNNIYELGRKSYLKGK